MGFPRILSKNNKVYTKLGEFCLSSDGNQFFIVCHTCQQELQTQDTFWKHIQDEHSFMHHQKHENENNRTNQNYIDGPTAASVDMSPPAASLVPHYKKLNVKSDQDGGTSADDAEDDDEEEQEPKDYTEMRVIEPSDVQVNIKVEHPQMVQQSILTSPQPPMTTIYMPTTNASTATMQPQAISYASILQNMPHMGAGAILHSGSGAGGGVMPAVPPTLLQAHELPQKDPSSATSEDGERWYICDYETCGLKFKYQSRLELHRSVHSKVRRFACELCTASFKQSCNLSTHRKKKHNIKGSKFEPRF